MCTWGHGPKGKQSRKNSDPVTERPYDRSCGRGVLGCWRDPNFSLRFFNTCLSVSSMLSYGFCSVYSFPGLK